MDKKNTPEVKLGQYKGLAVTRHVRPVTDKTVDIELVHQTRMHAVYRPTTEPARRGFRACWTLPATWTAGRSPTAGWRRSWSCWATAS
mgnify:CR=1 FL=1